LNHRVLLQISLTLVAISLSCAVAILAYPRLTNNLLPNELAKVTILLSLSSMVGYADVTRPVYTFMFAKDFGKISLRATLVPSLLIGAIVGLALCLLLNYFYVSFDVSEAFLISLAVPISLISSPFWSSIDAKLQSGKSQLVRVFCVSLLYFLFVARSEGWFNFSFATIFFFHSVMSTLIFVYSAQNITNFGGAELPQHFWPEVRQNSLQNVGKFPADFADRIASAAFLSPEKVAVYNILYDLLSRANVFSQALAAYYYPAIIKEPNQSKKFLLMTNCIAVCLTSVSAIGFVYGDIAFHAYLGKEMESKNVNLIISALISIFALHTHNFSSQTILRASGQHSLLSAVQTSVAVLACVAIAPAFQIYGLSGGLAVATILRLPGSYLLIFRVEKNSNSARLVVVATVVANVSLVAICCKELF
jgi:O-antigen/teichoic acid export membrane protein